ncbi:hypothetical protein [Massilia sp. CF038]|uniref:hypothetical protein n=1 Tax=Massilia sp. CF038 TaxID=1881045 RepID=UPI0009147A25|nr:hypothetical protein [Massilia sp. CF038]SHH63749.1 hypothetical protein SAMN05428948_4752 [Massilia sp. CF038]
MQPITVRYRINTFQVLLITLITFGLSGAALLATHRQVLQAEPADLVWTIYMCLALAFGTLIAYLLVVRDREKMHWQLSEHELVGGMKRPVRIPIDSIVSISIGVPARTEAGANNPWLKSGIVLKTKDNRILSLNVATTGEGARMMEALLLRCSSVLTREPIFTSSELAILHRLKWNLVLDAATGRPVQ